MISENLLFQRFWFISLSLHVVFFVLLFILPSGGPSAPMPVYTVKIVDVPAQPSVRALDLATGAISELKVESASLLPKAPVPSQLDVPTAGMVTPPDVESALPAPPKAPPLAPAPKAPAAISEQQALPTPPPALPQAPPAQAAAPPTALPSAPLERLREKVQSLQLKFGQVEEKDQGTGLAPSDSPSSILSLRIYQNKLQEAIKQKYKFPGSFPEGLQVRVKVTLRRDGTVQDLVLLESSGNQQFDYAATLALRRAKFPPLPDTVEEETLTQVILFSP